MEIFCVKIKKPVHVLCFDITVGADPCVRPAGTRCVFHPFTANSQ
nr:MAG TPA: hypothetical protein [Caudoviricetes sp.]